MPKISWEEINTSYDYKPQRSYKDIEQIVKENSEELIDLRPYMIVRPYTVATIDKL